MRRMGFPEQPEMALSKNGSNIINQLDFVYPTCSDKPIHNIDCKLKTPLYPIIMYNNNSIMVYIYNYIYIYKALLLWYNEGIGDNISR